MNRDECPTPDCGGTLGYTGERRENHAGHHVHVFECGMCGAEVLRG